MRGPAAERIKDMNVRYHDVAAADYDFKWSIAFDENGRRQVLTKMGKALGRSLSDADVDLPRAGHPAPLGRSLEIGAGTGYFTLNLALAGLVERPVATDISPGMLDALATSAERLGLGVETRRCDAERLPFPDDSFDLVLGHAVLHHLPDLDAAFTEFRRVLRPGGRIAFCGEPSRYGDRLARVPKRAALAAAPLWRALLGAAERGQEPSANGAGDREDGHAFELFVDVHSFTPGELAARARGAGFEDVTVRGEELSASLFGWINRCLEATTEPGELPRLWHEYAFRGYLAFKALDDSLLEPTLPPALFYNLLLSGRAP